MKSFNTISYQDAHSINTKIHSVICYNEFDSNEHIENVLMHHYKGISNWQLEKLFAHGNIFRINPYFETAATQTPDSIFGMPDDVCIFYRRDKNSECEYESHIGDSYEYENYLRKLNSTNNFYRHYLFVGDKWYYTESEVDYFRKVQKVFVLQDII